MTADQTCFQFDSVEVYPGAFEVRKSGVHVPLEPKSIRVLLYLIENRDRAVGKDELIRSVWSDAAVTDNALTRVIAQLRRELGDDARHPRYIQTIPTLGYRFVADVQTVAQNGRQTVPAPSTPRLRRLYVWVAVAVLAAAGVVLAWSLRARATSGSETTRTAQHVQITSAPGLDLSPGFSPDGRSIAYSSDRNGRFEIYLRRIEDRGAEVQITNDGGQNIHPAVSPDGKSVAYHSVVKGGIWLVPVGGGQPVRLIDSGCQPSWSPDGRSIAFRSGDVFSLSAHDLITTTGSAIVVMPSSGGAPVVISPASLNVGRQAFPSWTPDGKRVIFSSFDGRQGALWSVAPDGSSRKRLLTADRNLFISPIFGPQGDTIYYGAMSKTRDLGLWQLKLNSNRDGADGEPVELARTGTAIPRDLAISPDGKRLVYTSSTLSSTLWHLRLNPAGDGLADEPRPLYDHVVFRTSFSVFSPDGKHIAFFARLFGGLGDIWVMNADGSGAAPLTSSSSQDLLPSWTPDGSAILYTRHTDAGAQLWQISLADRSEKPLLNGKQVLGWPRLSPDGHSLVYHTSQQRPMNIWTTEVESGKSVQLTHDSEGAGYPAWSRDGKRIAYELFRGKNTYLAVMNRDGENQMQLNSDAGHSWVFDWSPDSRKLAFAGFRDGSWNIWWFDTETNKQVRLTNHTSLATYVRYPSWSPDGTQIVFEHSTTRGNIYAVELR